MHEFRNSEEQLFVEKKKEYMFPLVHRKHRAEFLFLNSNIHLLNEISIDRSVLNFKTNK